MALSDRGAVEFFHLVFLSQLGARLDRKLYSIKGGCNFRFFFGSPRFSEDLDLDVATVQKSTLARKMERLLCERPIALQLSTRSITISGWSAPKQTDTTQRWKVQLAIAGHAGLHTKIEFSRRRLDPGSVYGPVEPTLIGSYGLPAISATHYGQSAALGQKILALVGRSETQARDVYDLDFLLRSGTNATGQPEDVRKRLSLAATSVASVTFDQFSGQVLPYLPDPEQETWDEERWAETLARVTAALGTAR